MTEHRSSLQLRGRANRAEMLLVWVLGHLSRVWPLLVLAIVAYLTSDALRRVHPREVGTVVRALDVRWLGVAVALTCVNVAVMGLYDVAAFGRTGARWTQRWRFGAVAFAWSNFLTLGPLAGPAIRLWLYRPYVTQLSVLPGGIVSVSIAFVSGLGGWLLAAVIMTPSRLASLWGFAALSLPLVAAGAWLARRIAERFERLELPRADWRVLSGLAIVGWLDWLLAGAAFAACLRAVGGAASGFATARSFFFGQAIGLASLVPGGLGSSDAFWITHLPVEESLAAAALVAYRFVYYIAPWVAASLALLAIATRRGSQRVVLARWVVAGLVGLGGAIMLLSAGSPAIGTRLSALEEVVPLPLVEAGHLGAALAGLLLLVLARGLALGYRAALHATLLLLTVAAAAALLKGLDWEEAAAMAFVGVAAWSQSALFERRSRGHWLEGRDVGIAAVALLLFIAFGSFSHRVSLGTVARWTHAGYHVQAARFIRSAAVLTLGVSAAALYVGLRVPVSFTRLAGADIDRALALHARIGKDTSPLMVANGDKDVFFFEDLGFCLYRTVGPYLVVFSDPSVMGAQSKRTFLDALFAFAADLDRRPVFYQISIDWIPPLHDRGYDFFKLGEEAWVPLDRFTLEGPAGKMNRQILRRGERDGLSFEVLTPEQAASHAEQLRRISDDWLRSKGVKERQFSIGFFDEDYLSRFPCAVVRARDSEIVAFANLLPGPGHHELSVDLMRYGARAPRGVMDFLFVALFRHGRDLGYARFSLGMAPLATVGAARGAHLRERLAHLLFQHGETWYNFQGLRAYKEKFEPEWVPRYMAYDNAWAWPAAITHVSALIAGGWNRILKA